MSRFLFTLWDGGGNSPPVLSVAAALARRGHDVRVMADPTLREDVLATGARHLPWATAPQRSSRDASTEFVRDFEARTPMGATARLRDRLIVGPAPQFARDTCGELRREPADAVISEALLMGSQVAAEAAGLPNITLVPNIYPGEVPGVPPFGIGLGPRHDRFGQLRDRIVRRMGSRLWDKRLTELNALRNGYDLPSVSSVFAMLERPDRVLVLTSAAFELGGGERVPAHVRYCGPRLDDPGWVRDWNEPRGTDPLVLVSLSTTTQGQDPMIRRVVEALGRLRVRGLVTTGPSFDGDGLQAPPNVTIVASAPHSAVLPHAAAVVTHAGHGTVIKALAQGVPLVCLPVGRDQPDTAERVAAAGAGLRLRPGARAKSIERALMKVLDDPVYRAGAMRIAAAIDVDHEHDRAVEEIEAITAAAPTLA
ncbi:MAG: glycosyltransferase family 1 protein [Thermoleophilia bacterium]|nr:glycosyltransferase family 1 protein [Thermoleophilia bacterium]